MLFIFTNLFQEITNLIVQKPASSQLVKLHSHLTASVLMEHVEDKWKLKSSWFLFKLVSHNDDDIQGTKLDPNDISQSVIIGLQGAHCINQSEISPVVPGQRSPCQDGQRCQLQQNSWPS